MLQRTPRQRAALFDQLPTAWMLVAGTLLIVLILALLAAAPLSWLYGAWAPARDFRGATLEQVVDDFEATGVLPKGSTWASDSLKQRRVTVRYSFSHQPATVIEIVASKVGVVISGQADSRCSICGLHIQGPVHIRPATDREANVRWVRPSEPTAPQRVAPK
jgi:hypothetical protein